MADERELTSLVHNGTIIVLGRESPYFYKWRCSCGSEGRKWFKKRLNAEQQFFMHMGAQPGGLGVNEIPVSVEQQSWINTMIAIGNGMAAKCPDEVLAGLWEDVVERYKSATR